MSYSYEVEREKLFTDEGQKVFIAIRDTVKALLKTAGCVRAQEAIKGVSGNTWTMMACLDRMVELGELREVENPISSWGQHRLFVDPKDRP